MDGDDDLPSGSQPPGERIGDVDEDNCTKRRRVNGSSSLVNVDVSGLNEPNRRNRFAILADLEIESNGNVGRNINDNTSGSKKTEKTAGMTFCPPIFLYNVNIQHLVKQLDNISPKISFKIKNVNQHKSKLYVSDVNVHLEMMALLRDKKINSYSFTPKEHKQISLVLRGMYHGTNITEIQSAIDVIIPGVVAKVSKFNTTFSSKNKVDSGLFLISLLPGKKLNDVSHIKYLLNQCIIWEKPKKKEQEIQCRRCQLWGHIAKNCNAEYKCVKCNQQHLPGECPRNALKDTDPSCINCGESGHPANWRGCSYYKKYVSNKKERIIKTREAKTIASNNVIRAIPVAQVTPGTSYASHFKTQQIPQQRPSLVEEFMNLAHSYLEPELTLEQEIENFLANRNNMSDIDAKAEFLRLFYKVKKSYP